MQQLQLTNGMESQWNESGGFEQGQGSKRSEKGKEIDNSPQLPNPPKQEYSLVELTYLSLIFSQLNIESLDYSEKDLVEIIRQFIFNITPPFDETFNKLKIVIQYYKVKAKRILIEGYNNSITIVEKRDVIRKRLTDIRNSMNLNNFKIFLQEYHLENISEEQVNTIYYNLHHEAYPLENIFILWNLNKFTDNLINSFLRAYRHDTTYHFINLMIYYNAGKYPLKEISIEEYLEASKRILENAEAFKKIMQNSNTLNRVNYPVLIFQENYPAVYSQELDRKYFKFMWMAYLKDVGGGQQQTGGHTSRGGGHAGGQKRKHHN
ncbi:hypothetical protein ACQ4LE_007855 [Meloidogyne hapla]